MDDSSDRHYRVCVGARQYVVDRLGGLVMAIKSEATVDDLGRTIVTLTKSRGKLTMAEIQEYLQQHMPGVYAILLRAREDAYDDWPIETTGDAQDLYLYDNDCPICGHEPPDGHCPKCGANLHDAYMDQLGGGGNDM